MHSFHWADYLVLAVVLIGSLLTGVFFACHGGKQRTTGEYFQGNRRLSLIPTALSIMVSYISGKSKVVSYISGQSIIVPTSQVSSSLSPISQVSPSWSPTFQVSISWSPIYIRSVHHGLLYIRSVHHGLLHLKLIHHASYISCQFTIDSYILA